MVKELFERRGSLPIYDTRADRLDYCEFVISTTDLEGWMTYLSSAFGPAVKPAGTKPSDEQASVAAKYGGIQKDQTLFMKSEGSRASVAMLWPWRNGEQVTVKMAESVPTPAVEAGGAAAGSVAPARSKRRLVVKALIWAGAALVIVIAVFSIAMIVQMRQFQRRLAATVVENVKPGDVADGVYDGVCDLGPVMAKVKVLVQGGRIEAIKVTDHRHGPGYGAEAITSRIVEGQSLDVNAVSGATASSTAIRKAVEVALKSGLRARPAEGAGGAAVPAPGVAR